MSLPHNEEMIEIRVGSSTRFTILTSLCHVGAALAIWVSSLHWSLFSFFSVLLLLHGIYFYSSRVDRVLALRYQNGVWYLQTHKGWSRVWLAGEALVTPFLISLRFRQEDLWHRYSVNLFSDSERLDKLHALRLRLLLEGRKPSNRYS